MKYNLAEPFLLQDKIMEKIPFLNLNTPHYDYAMNKLYNKVRLGPALVAQNKLGEVGLFQQAQFFAQAIAFVFHAAQGNIEQRGDFFGG